MKVNELKPWGRKPTPHNKATVDWRFNTTGARIKLKKLYPAIHFEENVKNPTRQTMIYTLLG
jgi:hypothetical protein